MTDGQYGRPQVWSVVGHCEAKTEERHSGPRPLAGEAGARNLPAEGRASSYRHPRAGNATQAGQQPERASCTPHVVALILGATFIRLFFAASLGLGVDESYMVASGRQLALGYFDHPPAAWWLSWAAAHLGGSEAPLVVRLPFIGLFAVSTWLMYRLGTTVGGQRAGLWAAVLLNLSPVFGVTTGTWVLPDGPLTCALLGAALCLVHGLAEARGRAFAWWCGSGVCAGLGLFSKYTAMLSIAGAVAFLLSSREHRVWLTRAEPYVAALIALLIFTPVLAWNASHHWASFAFQSERAAGVAFHPLGPFIVFAGEALFVLPWIWAPMMVLFIAALRRGPGEWRSWLLSCLAAPPILVFALVAAWSGQRVLFHWAAPGYLMLFPLLGAAVAARIHRAPVQWAVLGTAAFVVAGVVVIATAVRWDWLHGVTIAVMDRDPEAEAIDWTSLRGDLVARGLIHPSSPVGVPDWRNTGKIAHALGPEVTVFCVCRDARQFGLSVPADAFKGEDVLLLVPDHAARTVSELSPHFTAIEPLQPVEIRLSGRPLQEVSVFVGHGFRGL